MATVYVGSDGQCYTEDEVLERYESGGWEFCAAESESGQEIVRTESGDVVLLTPLGAEGQRLEIRE